MKIIIYYTQWDLFHISTFENQSVKFATLTGKREKSSDYNS